LQPADLPDARRLSFGGEMSIAADPLPQAFVLTAIVIAFAITVVLATLAIAGRGDDDTESEQAENDSEVSKRGESA
jgi:Multisubunit Na+/H+ antiporter, MnhC subunit